MSFAETVRRAVVFAILMETHGGILHKSPDYVYEKFKLAMTLPASEKLLDPGNMEVFYGWMQLWGPLVTLEAEG